LKTPTSKTFELLGENSYEIFYSLSVRDTGDYVFLVQAVNEFGGGEVIDHIVHAYKEAGVERALNDETPTVIAETNELATFIQLYPNPSNGNINVYAEIQNDATSEIKIFDMVGNKVKQIEFKKGINKIAINNLNPGVYFYQFINNGQIQKSDKIVIIE